MGLHIDNLIEKANATFMLREIFETDKIISKLKQSLENFNFIEFDKCKKIHLIGNGSSFTSAKSCEIFGKEVFDVDIEATLPSFFDAEKFSKDSLLVFISQSGETKNLLKLSDLIGSNNKLAITNSEQSSLSKNCCKTIYLSCGQEHSIASTKCVSAEIFALLFFVSKVSKKLFPEDNFAQLVRFLDSFLQDREKLLLKISKIVCNLKDFETISILNGKFDDPIAKEAKLKITETSYIPTLQSPFEEYLHGHMAILNKKSLILCFFNQSDLLNQIETLKILKTKYKDFQTIGFGQESVFECDYFIEIEQSSNIFCEIFGKLLLSQIFSCFLSCRLNLNPDKPFGLTKVVK